MTTLPASYCARIDAGEPPLTVWREYLGLERSDLRRDSGIAIGVIEKVETGKRTLTRDQAKKLARVMNIHAHNLMPGDWATCSDLDVDEDAIVAEYEGKQPVTKIDAAPS